MTQQSAHFQWGNINLCLDNASFRGGFEEGRRAYFEDIHGEFPERAQQMLATDVSSLVLCRDSEGRYNLGPEGLLQPLEYLGFLLGYMSGPWLAETEEERARRLTQENGPASC